MSAFHLKKSAFIFDNKQICIQWFSKISFLHLDIELAKIRKKYILYVYGAIQHGQP